MYCVEQVGQTSLGIDAFDHYLGELLTVTILLYITLAAFLFEDDHFLALYMGKHLTCYGRTRDSRDSNVDGAVVVHQQYFVESDGVTFFGTCQMMGIYEAVFLYLELLSGDFYNCVHSDFVLRKSPQI
jgi:hypothetical protein